MSNKGFYVEGIKEVRDSRKIANIETKKIKHIKQRRRYVRKVWFLRSIEIECQLHRGSGVFPRTELLTMVQMGQKNRLLVLDYIKDLDEGKDRPLWSWKIKDYTNYKKALTAHIDSGT